jgi:pilus assembly protein TadC
VEIAGVVLAVVLALIVASILLARRLGTSEARRKRKEKDAAEWKRAVDQLARRRRRGRDLLDRMRRKRDSENSVPPDG